MHTHILLYVIKIILSINITKSEHEVNRVILLLIISFI